MDMSAYQTLIPAAVAISTVGGAWLTIRKIAKDAEKSKKDQAATILQMAKEADNAIKAKIEARVEAVEVQLLNLKESVQKDMDHLKETYNGEIRNLGEKIEGLRIELRDQHGNLVQLLTKLIENRD